MLRSLTVSYREDMIAWLKQVPDGGLGYLTAAWEDSPDTFLIALKDVVDPRGGVTKLAKKTGLHRVSLHTMLSKAGNPRLDNLGKILAALNIRLTLAPIPPAKRCAKAG